MRKVIMSVLAALAASGYGFTPQAHTNTVTRDGVTYVQRGALGADDYVVTNVDAQTVGRVQSVNGKTGAVVIGADDVGALTNTTTHLSGDVPTSRKVNGKALTSDITLNAVDVNARPNDWTPNASQVGALPDNQASLEANTNFRAAVATVSPPAEIPAKWALANVTNASGNAVSAADVQAVPTTRTVNGKQLSSDVTLAASDVGAISKQGTTAGTFPITITDSTEESKSKVIISYDDIEYMDEDGSKIEISPTGFATKLIGTNHYSRLWKDIACESYYDTVPRQDSTHGVTSHGIYTWTYQYFLSQSYAAQAYLTQVAASTNYLSQSDAQTTYLSKSEAGTTYLTQQNAQANYLTKTDAATTYMTQNAAGNLRTKSDLNVYVQDWNIETLVDTYCPAQSGRWVYRISAMTETPICLMVEFRNPNSGQWNIAALSAETYPTVADANAATSFTVGMVMESIFNGLYYKTVMKGGTRGTLATSTDLAGYVPTSRTVNGKALTTNITLTASDISDAVPNTRKVNGQALTSDITIQGMTADAVVLTNGTLKTYDGRAVDAMDYPALTNTVNAVKAQYWDAPLAVNWTVDITNGDMHFSATTNVNQSVLN